VVVMISLMKTMMALARKKKKKKEKEKENQIQGSSESNDKKDYQIRLLASLQLKRARALQDISFSSDAAIYVWDAPW